MNIPEINRNKIEFTDGTNIELPLYEGVGIIQHPCAAPDQGYHVHGYQTTGFMQIGTIDCCHGHLFSIGKNQNKPTICEISLAPTNVVDVLPVVQRTDDEERQNLLICGGGCDDTGYWIFNGQSYQPVLTRNNGDSLDVSPMRHHSYLNIRDGKIVAHPAAISLLSKFKNEAEIRKNQHYNGGLKETTELAVVDYMMKDLGEHPLMGCELDLTDKLRSLGVNIEKTVELAQHVRKTKVMWETYGGWH